LVLLFVLFSFVELDLSDVFEIVAWPHMNNLVTLWRVRLSGLSLFIHASAFVEVVSAWVVIGVSIDTRAAHAVLRVLNAAILLGLSSKWSMLSYNFSVTVSKRRTASLPRSANSVVVKVIHEDFILFQSLFLLKLFPFGLFSDLLVE